MNMIVAERIAQFALPALTVNETNAAYLDPLDNDRPDDEVVVTTRRAICRVALVAAETAGRFQREAVPHDPMTWMLAPRTLFSGANALEACLDRDACLRGILLHGLSLGLDADPMTIDALAAEDDETDLSTPGSRTDPEAGGCGANVLRFPPEAARKPRLFTATVVSDDGFETVHAFHASFAVDEAEIAGRLYMRMGAAAADAAIVIGFDHTSPIVEALVSPAMCDTLMMIDAEQSSPLAAGIDVNIEQRFFC